MAQALIARLLRLSAGVAAENFRLTARTAALERLIQANDILTDQQVGISQQWTSEGIALISVSTQVHMVLGQ